MTIAETFFNPFFKHNLDEESMVYKSSKGTVISYSFFKKRMNELDSEIQKLQNQNEEQENILNKSIELLTESVEESDHLLYVLLKQNIRENINIFIFSIVITIIVFLII